MKFALTIDGNTIQPPSGIQSGGIDVGTKIIQLSLTIAFVGAVVLAIAVFIYSGIEWTISGGDKEKIQNARNRLIYAIVGLVLILAAFFIVKFVLTILGYKSSFFF